MKRITRLCLLACAGLASLAHSSAAEDSSWPFFAFDNGVGRGVWPASKQAATVKNLGYDGIHYNYTNPKDFAAKLSACRAAGVPIHAVYIYAVAGDDMQKLSLAIESWKKMKPAVLSPDNLRASQ